MDEDQTEALLERAQTEVFSIKQKLDNDLKQEKRKLCQRLMIKRRREMLQKVCEGFCPLFFPGPPRAPARARGQPGPPGGPAIWASLAMTFWDACQEGFSRSHLTLAPQRVVAGGDGCPGEGAGAKTMVML